MANYFTNLIEDDYRKTKNWQLEVSFIKQEKSLTQEERVLLGWPEKCSCEAFALKPQIVNDKIVFLSCEPQMDKYGHWGYAFVSPASPALPFGNGREAIEIGHFLKKCAAV